MHKISTILFDLDGVLVEAKDWHFEAINEALLASGYEAVSLADHLTLYDGLPTRKKLALIAQKQNIPPHQWEDINSLKQEITSKIVQQRCHPTLSHMEAVRKLKDEAYQLAVCSNSVRTSVALLLEKTGLSSFFSFTLSNEDVRHPKPHPEIYLTAMERFGALPEQTLILEDNINGIRAAQASGGYVLEIKDIHEVNYDNIVRAISAIEQA